MYLQNCWAPCFTLERGNKVSLESGSVLIAVYTAVLHVLTFFYFLYIYFGGPTDQFYLPLFELDLNSTRYWSVILVLYSLTYVLSSYWLNYGVKKEIRFFYWPWLLLTMLEIFFMFGFGYFMIYRYYHYGWAVFAWILLWFYSFFHVYMFYAIVSQYYYLKELQEPTFLVLV